MLMHIIHKLYECALEELEEAEEYAELALEYKTVKPELANSLIRLSEEETTQADKLVSLITTLCDEKKREGKLTDHDTTKNEGKIELYNMLKAKVKTLQAAYKM